MKIALIGSAPSSIYLAPYQTEWKIWGCSPGALVIGKHAHAWFEIHRYEPGQPWFSEGYCKFLEEFEGPVYMAEHVPSIKNCVVLPVEALVEKYGPHWFTSSLAWMFALAIEENPESIGLWGVDMAAHEEYYSQKLGLIRFAEIAVSQGIEVGTSPYSDLFTPHPLYGVCETSHVWIKTNIRRLELQQQLRDAERQFEESKQKVQLCRGAVDDLDWNQKTWHGNMPARSYRYDAPIVPKMMQSPVRRINPANYNNPDPLHYSEVLEAPMTCVEDLFIKETKGQQETP